MVDEVKNTSLQVAAANALIETKKPDSMVTRRGGFFQGSPAHSWREVAYHLIEHRGKDTLCSPRCMARHIFGRDTEGNRQLATAAVWRTYARFRDDRALAREYSWHFPIVVRMPMPLDPEDPEAKIQTEERFMLVGSDEWQLEAVQEILDKRIDRLAENEKQLGNLHNLLRRLQNT